MIRLSVYNISHLEVRENILEPGKIEEFCEVENQYIPLYLIWVKGIIYVFSKVRRAVGRALQPGTFIGTEFVKPLQNNYSQIEKPGAFFSGTIFRPLE